jgi:hypothetical protein
MLETGLDFYMEAERLARVLDGGGDNVRLELAPGCSGVSSWSGK